MKKRRTHTAPRVFVPLPADPRDLTIDQLPAIWHGEAALPNGVTLRAATLDEHEQKKKEKSENTAKSE